MDPIVTGALVGAGASIFGGGVSAAGSAIRNRKQWQYRQKEMALQQEYALAQMQKQYDFWKKQTDYMNVYNEPSALLARWRSAGVTPAGVLGQSGVSVSGNSASGPGSSGQGIGASGMDVQNSLGALGSSITGAAAASGEMMLARTAADRNRAAANRDNAEADRLAGETHTRDWRAAMDAFNLSLAKSNASSAEDLARLNAAQADIMELNRDFMKSTEAYRLEEYMARVARLKEEYFGLREYNVKYLNSEYEAGIALTWMRVFETAARAENIGIESDVASLRLKDMQNWFSVNWETKVKVPRYDDKGKQIGFQELTGKEIFATLLSLDLSEADLSRGLNRWRLRSEKNALGYGILRTLVGVGAGVAGAVVTKGLTSTPPVEPQDYDTYQESYDRFGDYVGGTRVRRRYLREK